MKLRFFDIQSYIDPRLYRQPKILLQLNYNDLKTIMFFFQIWAIGAASCTQSLPWLTHKKFPRVQGDFFEKNSVNLDMAIRPGNSCARVGRIGDVVVLRGMMFEMIFVASGKFWEGWAARQFFGFEEREAHIKDLVKGDIAPSMSGMLDLFCNGKEF